MHSLSGEKQKYIEVSKGHFTPPLEQSEAEYLYPSEKQSGEDVQAAQTPAAGTIANTPVATLSNNSFFMFLTPLVFTLPSVVHFFLPLSLSVFPLFAKRGQGELDFYRH